MEKILVVPTSTLQAMLREGLFDFDEAQFLQLVAREGLFKDRTDALENDTAFKQIIPYVLVEHAGRFLVYQRTKKQGDARIHGKCSIGFGGHVNPTDAHGQHPLIGGRTRELNEEIGLEGTPRFTFLGLLNANGSPIDAFHLGAVYQASVDSDAHTFRETEKFVSKGWQTLEEIAQNIDALESWSQILARKLQAPALTAHR